MAMSDMFNVGNSFDAPSQTLYDKLLEQRKLLEQQRPDVAAQMPALGANTPGQQMYQAEQQQPVADLATGLSALTGQLTQSVAGPEAKPKDQQAVSSSIGDVLSYLDPLKPKQSYGPNIGASLGMPQDAGGILGLGIQPIDLLAFAAGAALTRNMPQEHAMNMTFRIAGMPSEFRKSQEENARKFIQQKMEAITGQTSAGNLQQRQLESAIRVKQMQDQESFISALEGRLKTGQPLGDLEKQLFSIRAKRAGIDPKVINELLLKKDAASQLATIQEIKQVAEANKMGSVRGNVQLEGGGTVTIGGGGGSGRPLTTGELTDALSSGKNTDRLMEAGYDISTPQGRAVIEQGVKARQQLERERITISNTNSERAQQSFEMLRPVEQKELSGLAEIHRGTKDMLSKYEAALASHGGKFTPGLKLALVGATSSPDSYIGMAKQALAQMHPDLTQADLDFVARYANMQKFSRGLLNDVGNLSNFERGLVTTMMGTPFDNPALFRTRAQTIISDAEVNFNKLRSTLVGKRDLGDYNALSGSSAPTTEKPPKGAKVRDYTTLGQ